MYVNERRCMQHACAPSSAFAQLQHSRHYLSYFWIIPFHSVLFLSLLTSIIRSLPYKTIKEKQIFSFFSFNISDILRQAAENHRMKTHPKQFSIVYVHLLLSFPPIVCCVSSVFLFGVADDKIDTSISLWKMCSFSVLLFNQFEVQCGNDDRKAHLMHSTSPRYLLYGVRTQFLMHALRIH